MISLITTDAESVTRLALDSVGEVLPEVSDSAAVASESLDVPIVAAETPAPLRVISAVVEEVIATDELLPRLPPDDSTKSVAAFEVLIVAASIASENVTMITSSDTPPLFSSYRAPMMTGPTRSVAGDAVVSFGTVFHTESSSVELETTRTSGVTDESARGFSVRFTKSPVPLVVYESTE
ncbi:MAG TPA: hypothetical protein PK765_04030 [bacterium]|nr:hypothetical protein [bacterium]